MSESVLNKNRVIKIYLFGAFVLFWLLLSLFCPVVFAGCEDDLKKADQEYSNEDFKLVISILNGVLTSPDCSDENRRYAFTLRGATHYWSRDSLAAEVDLDSCIISDTSYGCLEANFETQKRSGTEICHFFERVKSRLFVQLKITSEPPGATVYIDGDSVGTTTDTITIENMIAGKYYNVRLKLECYREINSKIFIEKGRSNSKDFKLERLFCPIEIYSDPSGATVLIDGNMRGTTSLMDSVACGEKHQIVFKKKGYRCKVKKVECLDSKSLDVTAYMDKIKRPPIVLPAIATALTAVAGGSIWYFDKEAKDYYKKYKKSVSSDDINENWNECEKNIDRRCYSKWTTGGLGLVSAGLWVWYCWPREGKDLCSLEPATGNSKKVKIALLPGCEQVHLIISKRF
jgi:hypothetical protein